jgi:hypothetical protein
MKRHSKINWRTEQPTLGDEVVIFVNHSVPVFHIIKWKPTHTSNSLLEDLIKNTPDWDIKLESGMYVGPRNFEGGSHFIVDVSDKEFYWMPKDEFLDILELL